MNKLEVAVADRDEEYMELLAGYVRSTEWSHKLSIRRFSNEKSLMEHIQNGGSDLYLVGLPVQAPGGLAANCWIRLHERESDDGRTGSPGLLKYQPLNMLLQQALDIWRKSSADGANTVSGRMFVCSVFSAAGGAGKSTVALRLARALAEMGERSLYWSLEIVPTSPDARAPDAELAARMVYGLRTGAPWVGERLSGLLQRGPYGFDCFFGFGHVRETAEFSGDDLGSLLALLRKLNRYDAIVFDLESTLNSRMMGALAASDRIVWLIGGDSVSEARTERMFEAMRQWEGGEPFPDPGKTMFVRNKHIAGTADAIEGRGASVRFEKTIRHVLPYISAWKNGQGTDLSARAPLFDEPIHALAASLRRMEGGIGNVG